MELYCSSASMYLWLAHELNFFITFLTSVRWKLFKVAWMSVWWEQSWTIIFRMAYMELKNWIQLAGNRFQRRVPVCQRQGTSSVGAMSSSKGLRCSELASGIIYVTAGMLSYWLIACVMRAQIMHLHVLIARCHWCRYCTTWHQCHQGRFKAIADYLCNVYLCYVGANQ